MKQKHTTRRERQAVRQMVEQKIQALETRALPRRAALALLKMKEVSREHL